MICKCFQHGIWFILVLLLAACGERPVPVLLPTTNDREPIKTDLAGTIDKSPSVTMSLKNMPPYITPATILLTPMIQPPILNPTATPIFPTLRDTPIPLPMGLTLDEYALIKEAKDFPDRLGVTFRNLYLYSQADLNKRKVYRDKATQILDRNNSLLAFFGYQLKPYTTYSSNGAPITLYELYKEDQLLLGKIAGIKPATVNAAKSDFVMDVIQNDTWKWWQVSKAGLDPVDQEIPPVFLGNDLITLAYEMSPSKDSPPEEIVKVLHAGEVIYQYNVGRVSEQPPVHGLWVWDHHWVLELTGVVIQDGVNLNAKFGYEKIFGWQLLNNKPFYFFKKNGLIQASYANEIIPLQYEELIHDRCCEQAVNNLQGDDAMVWYLAWRDGTWYYGELGVYP